MNPFGSHTAVQVIDQDSEHKNECGSTRGGTATETLVQLDAGGEPVSFKNEQLRAL
jgi:hypothetical protein